MLPSLVGIRRIQSAIGSMVWSLHYLNCLIQRRRHSIATMPPLVTITQTWSWFSRCPCLYRSREILYNFIPSIWPQLPCNMYQGEESWGLFGNRCWLWFATHCVSDQDWGAVGFWVEQVWPTWCGGHQGKGCCHKDDSLAQGKACCNSKVICVLRDRKISQQFVQSNENVIDTFCYQVWWLGDGCSDKQREMKSYWFLLLSILSQISTLWSHLFVVFQSALHRVQILNSSPSV